MPDPDSVGASSVLTPRRIRAPPARPARRRADHPRPRTTPEKTIPAAGRQTSAGKPRGAPAPKRCAAAIGEPRLRAESRAGRASGPGGWEGAAPVRSARRSHSATTMRQLISRPMLGPADDNFIAAAARAPTAAGFVDEKPTATALCRATAGATLVTAAMTRSECGIVRALPFRTRNAFLMLGAGSPLATALTSRGRCPGAPPARWMAKRRASPGAMWSACARPSESERPKVDAAASVACPTGEGSGGPRPARNGRGRSISQHFSGLRAAAARERT